MIISTNQTDVSKLFDNPYHLVKCRASFLKPCNRTAIALFVAYVAKRKNCAEISSYKII